MTYLLVALIGFIFGLLVHFDTCGQCEALKQMNNKENT